MIRDFNERYKIRDFNVWFSTKVEKWKNKYAEALAYTATLDQNNLLIVVDYEEDADCFLSKLQELNRLYNQEKNNFENVKIIMQMPQNMLQKTLISNLISNFDDVVFIDIDNFKELDLKEKNIKFNQDVAEFAKGKEGTTFGVIYQISNPKTMYSNMVDYIDNGIVPLNYSAPVLGFYPNIFEEITGNLLQKISEVHNNWFLTNHPDKYDFWYDKYKTAKRNMAFAASKNNEPQKILIECAAQHPLIDGVYPGTEFAARLDRSIQLYNEQKAAGNEAKIYIPGSLHQIWVNEDGKQVKKQDIYSLSYAGESYLKKHGVPDEDIIGEKTNNQIMPDGVYNSADECRVASEIFKTNNFNRLLCVTSPGQFYRVALFYLNFGVIPTMYTAPTRESYHNVINEITGAIPNVMINCPSWQLKSTYEAATDVDDQIAKKARNERNPLDYLLEHKI